MQKKKPLNVLYEGMNYYKKKMILIYPDRIRVTVMRDIVKKARISCILLQREGL